MNLELQLNWFTESGFEALFKELYVSLCRYANAMVEDEMQAEEVVQDVFMKLWNQRSELKIETNIKSYLYRSVHNLSLNFLNHEKVKLKYKQYVHHRGESFIENAEQNLLANELSGKITLALNKIPEKCRTVFHLSRQEQLSNKEIAEKLQISIKTVENQMTKALKILREELKDYLPTIAMLLISIFCLN